MTQVEQTKREATKLAKAMAEMMKSLTGVMNYEVDLLGRQDYAGLNGLRVEKAKLIRNYQLSINRLAQNPDILKETGVDIREGLRTEGVKLDAASKRNAHELKSAIVATQALVQTIMDSARSQLTKDDGYKNTRDVRNMSGAYSPISDAVAIDKNV